MNEIRVSEALTIGPQPSKVRMEELYHEGFKTIVNLSRKGEEGMSFKPYEEEQIAEDFGLTYVHFPVSISSLKESTIDEFLVDIHDQQKPLYMHCRIGQRSGLFATIFHGLRKNLTTKKALNKGLSWRLWQAPYLTDLASKYLDHKRGQLEPAAGWGMAA